MSEKAVALAAILAAGTPLTLQQPGCVEDSVITKTEIVEALKECSDDQVAICVFEGTRKEGRTCFACARVWEEVCKQEGKGCTELIFR